MKKVLNKNNETFYVLPTYKDRAYIITLLQKINSYIYYNSDKEVIISEKQLMMIEEHVQNNYIDNIENSAIIPFKRRHVLRLQQVISRLSVCDNLAVYYSSNLVIKSDIVNIKTLSKITNTGYPNISISMTAKQLVVTLRISINNNTYSKSICIHKNYTYSYVLKYLLQYRCLLLNEALPDIIDLETGLSYIRENYNYITPYHEKVNIPIVLKLDNKAIKFKIAYFNSLLYSSRSNTGYTGVCLLINKSLNKTSVVLSFTKKGIRHDTITLSPEYGYKQALTYLINKICTISNIDTPSTIDYTTGLKWLLDNGYNELGISDYNTLLVDAISTTGYSNIFFYHDRGLRLGCLFTHNGKTYRKNMYLHKIPYRKALYALLEYKCGILGYPIPKNINYIKGMDTYLSLLNTRK